MPIAFIIGAGSGLVSAALFASAATANGACRRTLLSCALTALSRRARLGGMATLISALTAQW